MKDFIKKYYFKIIIITTVIILTFTLVPNENKHYLREDIDSFKENLFWQIIFILSIAIALTIPLYYRTYKNGFKAIIIDVFITAIFCLLYSFLFQNILVYVFLSANRIKSNEIVVKEYIVIEKFGNNNFIAKDLKSDEIISERDYFKRNETIKIESIKTNDTLRIKTQKGLLGIEFF